VNPGSLHLRRPARLLALAALCAALLATPAPTQALGPAVAGQNLSNTADQSELPRISYGGGWLVAIWGERGGKRLGFSIARPDGAWSPAEFLTTGSNTKVQPPDIVADTSGAAHIVYAVGDQVLYRHRPVGGGWSPAVPVGASTFANQTRITRAPNGTLWIVWRDLDGTAIYYRFSNDGGATWQAADERGLVADDENNMLAPAIAVDASNSPHVVWYIRGLGDRQGEIRYADWDGARFRPGTVTRDGSQRYDADPAILVSPDNIQHLVWRKQVGARWVIMHATRAPGGDWQDVERLTRTEGDAQFAPSIGTDERGDILIAYSDPTENHARRIMLLGRTPGGEWASFPISNGYFDSRSAVVGTVTGGNVYAHVLYQHEATVDDGEVLYSRVQVDFLAAPQPEPAPAPQPAPEPAAPAGGALEGALAPAAPRGDCAFFAETQHNLCGAFRNYWQRYGGLPIYGYPLTEEYSADGVVTQYFERTRFEYHPGLAPARFDVLLGLLGSERVAGRRESGEPAFQPAAPRAGCTFFAETQHNLCGAQRSYWQRYGGLPLYGYPLTDEFIENGVAVQYFERARLEHQPGAAPARFDVLAGRIGAEAIGR
jgi:hypothetical protein